LSTAWDKAIQANNQTYQADSLKALKVEIDEITKTMVDLANTQYNDNYIFSGANTKTLTYTMDENGNIEYNGTLQSNPDYVRRTEVADGVFETINTTGDKVFGWYKDSQALTEDGEKIFLDADGKEVIERLDPDGNIDGYEYADGSGAFGGTVDDLEPKGDYAGVLGALRCLSNGIQKVLDGNEAEGYEESLYVTPTGKYFLYVNGGEDSIHPEENIIRMSAAKAEEWKASHNA
jgi:flagellin-like hook-associated protein FlgL